ncbi:sensor histidine kinase [Spirosoma aerophilum]
MKNHALLQGILNGSSNAMAVYKPVRDSQGSLVDMRLVMLNDLSAKWMGFPAHQLAGQRWSELAQQCFWIERFEWLSQVLETDTDFEQEVDVRRPDGSYQRLKVSIQKVEKYVLITHYPSAHDKEVDVQEARHNALLERIFATSLLGIVVHRAIRDSIGVITDFRVIEVNEASLKMMGSLTTIKGQTLKQYHPQTETHGLFNQFVQVCETGVSFETERYYPHIGRWYILMGVQLGDGLVVTYQDITDRKTAEMARKQQSDLLAHITDVAQIGVVIYEPIRDQEGRIIDFQFNYFNAQAQKRLPLDWKQVINKSMRATAIFEDTDIIISHMIQVIETDTPVRLDMVLPNGHVLAVTFSTFGENIVSSGADVTKLRHTEQQARYNAELEQKVADRTRTLSLTLEELKKSKEELASALAAERELGELKSRFVAMASHEFRTPLTSISTSAALAGRYTNPDQLDKQKKHLDRINTSVFHLNSILEDFLSVSRLEEGKIRAQVTEVDLSRLVDEAVADIQGLLKPDQSVQLAIVCPDILHLDASLLRKILINLLSNAIKYSGPGSVVFIEGYCVENQLQLSVQDQGVGISEEDQRHLFQRFFRARNVSHVSGTGLGLHIVGQYVKAMGGHVSVQSELNKGTVVTLTLPLLLSSLHRDPISG